MLGGLLGLKGAAKAVAMIAIARKIVSKRILMFVARTSPLEMIVMLSC